MSTINNGSTAFPAIKIVAGDNYNPPKQYHMPGMTLRDYFAAKVLPTIYNDSLGGPGWRDNVANDAYRVADAMLKARNN